MALTPTLSRFWLRLAGARCRDAAGRREFRASAAPMATHNFTMPAMPPAKTEGQDRPTPQEETSGGLDKTESSPSQAEAPPSSKPNADAAAGGAADPRLEKSKGKGGAVPGVKAHKQTYPLYPSVQHLLLSNGLSKSDADKIAATGPNGRLLKGDVLAYLGKIEKSYASNQSDRISKLGHLDLSNIKKSVPEKDKLPAAPPSAPLAEPDMQIAVSVSLSAVIATQKRIQDTLGIFLPISTFIARASELANEDLPRSKARKVTADELFNSILGLDKVVGMAVSRGHYMPQITPLPAVNLSKRVVPKSPDIIDVLSGGGPRALRSQKAAVPAISAGSSLLNVFSVSVQKGEERRGRVFLDRVKDVLEAEPGRLIL